MKILDDDDKGLMSCQTLDEAHNALAKSEGGLGVPPAAQHRIHSGLGCGVGHDIGLKLPEQVSDGSQRDDVTHRVTSSDQAPDLVADGLDQLSDEACLADTRIPRDERDCGGPGHRLDLQVTEQCQLFTAADDSLTRDPRHLGIIA